MSTNSEDNFAAPFDAFLAGLDKHDEEEKLFMLSGLIELLRHTKSATDIMYMAELLVSLQYVDWSRIPFSVTKNLLSRSCHDDVRALGVPDASVASILQSALLLFLEELQAEPEEKCTFDDLWAYVKLAAEINFPQKPKEPPLNPKSPASTPEIFNSRLVRRVFEPAKFTPELTEKLRLLLVTYRGEMAGGKLSPEARGIAVAADGHFNVFLETGEFLEVPKDYTHLKISTAPEDFKNLSPSVLLTLVAIAPELGEFSVLDAEQVEAIAAGKLGKIRGTHFRGVADVDDITPLEHVFDIGREAGRIGVTGATCPVGAIVRFPVPASNKVVVLEAQQDSFGPYSTARLVEVGANGNDTVLMRHEAPRHHSLRGVYLFPLQDCLVSLSAIF